MARQFALSLLAFSLLFASGCTVCCAPFDDHYLYSGGRWTRTNPNSGRVGSAFDPAGSRIEYDAVTTASPSTNEPTPAHPPSQDNTQSILPDAVPTPGVAPDNYLPLNE